MNKQAYLAIMTARIALLKEKQRHYQSEADRLQAEINELERRTEYEKNAIPDVEPYK